MRDIHYGTKTNFSVPHQKVRITNTLHEQFRITKLMFRIKVRKNAKFF